MATLTIGTTQREYDEGTKFEYVAKDFQNEYPEMIALVTENGKIRELTKSVKKDAQIEFITLGDNIGHKAYVRTATMTLIKSINDVLGKSRLDEVMVEYAIGQGYYFELKLFGEALTSEELQKIKDRMQELVDADRPITKRAYPKEDAIRLFEERGMTDSRQIGFDDYTIRQRKQTLYPNRCKPNP